MATAADSVTQLKKIAEGREAEIFEYGEGRVLRLYHSDRPLEQAHEQAAILRGAASLGIRVPAVYDVETVDGRHGIILERIDGGDLFGLIASKPWRMVAISALCARLQADMHDKTAPGDLTSTRDAYRGAILRHKSRIPLQFVEAAIKRLDSLPDGDRVCHNDFHPGNVMLAGDEPVIIDWSNATRGAPEADFARSVLILRLGDPPPSMPWLIRFGALFARSIVRGAYNRAYRRARSVDEDLYRAWELPVTVGRFADDIPSEVPKLRRLIPELIARDSA